MQPCAFQLSDAYQCESNMNNQIHCHDLVMERNVQNAIFISTLYENVRQSAQWSVYYSQQISLHLIVIIYNCSAFSTFIVNSVLDKNG